MVLTAPVGELGLEEEVFAPQLAGIEGRSQRQPDPGLEVVAALVGGINRPEAGRQSQLGEGLGPVFLPGGAIEEVGDGSGRGHRAYCAMWAGGSGSRGSETAFLKMNNSIANNMVSAQSPVIA